MCFRAEGLKVLKHGAPITPLFLSLGDLDTAWAAAQSKAAKARANAKAAARRPARPWRRRPIGGLGGAAGAAEMPAAPTVEVHDLLAIVRAHDTGDGDARGSRALGGVGFVPASRNAAAVKRARTLGVGKARGLARMR